MSLDQDIEFYENKIVDLHLRFTWAETEKQMLEILQELQRLNTNLMQLRFERLENILNVYR